MARYRYAGPGPDISPEGGITRPGDEREFDAEPGWGPWELIPPPEEEDAPAADIPAAPFTAPVTPEGNM